MYDRQKVSEVWTNTRHPWLEKQLEEIASITGNWRGDWNRGKHEEHRLLEIVSFICWKWNRLSVSLWFWESLIMLLNYLICNTCSNCLSTKLVQKMRNYFSIATRQSSLRCKSLDLQSHCLNFQSTTEETPGNLWTQPHDIQYSWNRLSNFSPT